MALINSNHHVSTAHPRGHAAVKDEANVLCPICLLDDMDEMYELSEIVTTMCNHTFCRPCFVKMKAKSSVCAICRGVVEERVRDVVGVAIHPNVVNDQFELIMQVDFSRELQSSGNAVQQSFQNQYALPPLILPPVVPSPSSSSEYRSIFEAQYYLIITQKQSIFGSANKPHRDASYTMFDIVAYDFKTNIVQEKHLSVPIGRATHLPNYFRQLIDGSFRIYYESDNNLSDAANTSMEISFNFVSQVVASKRNTRHNIDYSGMWKDYRFMDLVNQVYDVIAPDAK
jgi:hypothetical protein